MKRKLQDGNVACRQCLDVRCVVAFTTSTIGNTASLSPKADVFETALTVCGASLLGVFSIIHVEKPTAPPPPLALECERRKEENKCRLKN
jgi:hypothetical protein